MLNRIILPATTRGEIVVSPSTNIEKTLSDNIHKKQIQQSILSFVFFTVAILLQILWVVLLLLIAPSISGIYKQ